MAINKDEGMNTPKLPYRCGFVLKDEQGAPHVVQFAWAWRPNEAEFVLILANEFDRIEVFHPPIQILALLFRRMINIGDTLLGD